MTPEQAVAHLEEAARYPNTFLHYSTTKEAIVALLSAYEARGEALTSLRASLLSDEAVEAAAQTLAGVGAEILPHERKDASRALTAALNAVGGEP